jgi:hypothetical protein
MTESIREFLGLKPGEPAEVCSFTASDALSAFLDPAARELSALQARAMAAVFERLDAGEAVPCVVCSAPIFGAPVMAGLVKGPRGGNMACFALCLDCSVDPSPGFRERFIRALAGSDAREIEAGHA